ncbi:MAG: SDR family oxidoreductase [Kiritimatiellae bacterium]|nr:SDR family oxidoreductase [Kiritimatiellia bacterium]
MKRFENKIAFVTGAGGYIGGTTARMLAAEGAKVAVCDITDEACAKTVRDICEAGGTAIAAPADVTDSVRVDAAVAKAVEAFGGLDIMVHVAGGSARQEMKPLADQSDEVIRRVLGVNLFGAFWASRAAARVMRGQGRGGRIVNISSIVAFNGLRGCVDYAASKGGIIAMTRALAKEMGEYGVTVNSVAPGIVQRPGAGSADSDYALKTNFLDRKCEATDIAETVLFLCSEAARFVTGQTWVVDGGRSLGMKGSD